MRGLGDGLGFGVWDFCHRRALPKNHRAVRKLAGIAQKLEGVTQTRASAFRAWAVPETVAGVTPKN